jgi:ribosomal protein L12E/L44/L45/RPP1/RPP2
VKVTNSTGIDLDVAALQQIVKAGESLDVDDATAAALIAQGWKATSVKRTTQSEKADEAETKKD